MDKYKIDKYTFITGATGGIGYELALVFAKNNHDLCLVARDIKKLREIKLHFENTYKIKVIIYEADLTLEKSIIEIYQDIKDNNIVIENIINNAGSGSFGRFHEVDKDKDLTMIDLNIKSLTYILKLFIPDLIKNGGGGIMNVASTAAFQSGPMMSVYYATKAYVLFLSGALRLELSPYNINVSTLCPGPTDTNFQSRAKVEKAKSAKGFMMTAESVAIGAYKDFKKGKEIIIPGFQNKVLVYGSNLLPRKLIHRIILKVNKG
ncbi:SDR family oxidoreductase [Clostridium algidicarnis]|uniref:SDR family NAD(P)-dependent oxidoreductase n=1 Tax=Clostridium algidicarnis TaxID=37659 RepID=UPI001C0D3DC1|nr:SDR family oxidoreductase [Clostridium algidicarnis]MBU3196503.1 SDR family oxidoreductase [Clostridium algidicarnis]